MNRTGFNPDVKIFSVASWEKELWLPRLDQLLAEIEKRLQINERWILGQDFITILKETADCDEAVYHDVADSPEEAAAQALLWILEQEAKHEN